MYVDYDATALYAVYGCVLPFTKGEFVEFVGITVELGRKELGTLPSLVLGGIIENQNLDFVMT
jgi:hypothetical protein